MPSLETSPYLSLFVFLLIAVAFPVVMLLVAKTWTSIFVPRKSNPTKNSNYECGLETQGSTHIQFKAHYYLYAILFLIFDVEILFLLPFAVTFTGLPAGALVCILVFILLLAEGLVWAWQRRYLEWK